jgi:AraC-like DNA-binding protein
MEIPIIYIGFAQAAFIAIIMLLKRPLKIADVILAIFMLVIAAMFALNIVQEVKGITKQTWIYSLTISLTYPALLYLYSKYVTVNYIRFQRKDYLHAIPFLAAIMLIFLFRNPEGKSFYFDIDHYEQLKWLRNSLGTVFVLLLWIYGIFALRNIINYRRQLINQYSFKSDRISLNWLLVLVVSFILVDNIIIISSTLYELQIIYFNINPLRNLSLLIFVYIVGIWGFRQNQLSSEIKPDTELQLEKEAEEPTSERYQKSGLKSDQANAYLAQLKSYMEETNAWKDNELSVALISKQTQIPKHYITQVLNEYLGKNFYTFVNEYRVEEAKKLIVSPQHSSWSIVAIAYECGFNSKTAFNNFFKKYTGLTPTEYRDRAKN